MRHLSEYIAESAQMSPKKFGKTVQDLAEEIGKLLDEKGNEFEFPKDKRPLIKFDGNDEFPVVDMQCGSYGDWMVFMYDKNGKLFDYSFDPCYEGNDVADDYKNESEFYRDMQTWFNVIELLERSRNIIKEELGK